MTGTEQPEQHRFAGFDELGKGGASLLDLGERIEAGDAMLFWLLRPSQLRSLG